MKDVDTMKEEIKDVLKKHNYYMTNFIVKGKDNTVEIKANCEDNLDKDFWKQTIPVIRGIGAVRP